MNIEEARDYCLRKPFATEDLPFGDDYLVFRVGGKIFAGLPLSQNSLLVLKCSAETFDEVTAEHLSIEQAWHWHKRLWMQVHLDGSDVSDTLVRQLTDQAYDLVFAKLPRRIREELAARR